MTEQELSARAHGRLVELIRRLRHQLWETVRKGAQPATSGLPAEDLALIHEMLRQGKQLWDAETARMIQQALLGDDLMG